MKTNQRSGQVFVCLAVLFTIATLMIAGCTDSTERLPDQTATIQAAQSEHTTSAIATRTASAQVHRNTVLQTPAFQQSSTIVTADTPDPSERAIPNGILIDGIRDITKGDSLIVSGRTSLPVGTDLIVKIVPVTMDTGTIAGDFRNLEKSSVIKVTGGSADGNRFSVTFETGDLPAAEHIVFVSDKNDEPANSSSEPTGVTGSALFAVIPR
jgi:hypothetical protein